MVGASSAVANKSLIPTLIPSNAPACAPECACAAASVRFDRQPNTALIFFSDQRGLFTLCRVQMREGIYSRIQLFCPSKLTGNPSRQASRRRSDRTAPAHASSTRYIRCTSAPTLLMSVPRPIEITRISAETALSTSKHRQLAYKLC